MVFLALFFHSPFVWTNSDPHVNCSSPGIKLPYFLSSARIKKLHFYTIGNSEIILYP